MQTPNPDTIADAKKCLLTGALYGCLLRGLARALLIELQIIAPNHQTEQGGGRAMEELVEGLKELKGFAIP